MKNAILSQRHSGCIALLHGLSIAVMGLGLAQAAPSVSRLTPPSELFAIASVCAVSVERPGLHTFSVTATQSDGRTVVANGDFEVAPVKSAMRRQ